METLGGVLSGSVTRGREVGLRLFAFLALSVASFFPAGAEARPNPGKAEQILVLLGDAGGAPFVDLFTRTFLSEFAGGGGSLRSVRVEYLDLVHLADRRARESLVHLLRWKFADTRFALVLAVNPAATRFVLQEGAFLARDAPLLCVYPGHPPPVRADGRLGLIGSMFDFGGTLRLALDLKPGARRVLLVAGSDPTDRIYEEQARRSFAPWEGRLAFESTGGLALPAILKRVSEAGDDTIVLYATIFADGAGDRFIPKEAAAGVAASSSQPVFGTYEPLLGTGVVGGSMLNISSSARHAAHMALVALRGEPPLPWDQKVVQFPNPPTPLFDWPQLERHGLDPGRLPQGVVFLRRPPNPWVQHRALVLSVFATLTVLVGSTVVLAIQNRRRRAAERVAVEKQKWVQVLIDAAPDAIAVYDADQDRFVDANPAAEQLFGCPRRDLLCVGPAPFYLDPMPGDPYVRDSIARLATRALDGEVFSYQRTVLGRDGRLIPCQIHLTPLPALDRRLVRVSYVNLSELRRTEDELHSSQASLRALIENTADPIWSVDLQFRLLTFNQALAGHIRRHFGVEATPGMLPTDLQPPELASRWVQLYERVLSEGAFRQEFIPIPEGERLELSFNPIRQDGAVVGISVFCKDITEQRHLREQLNQSQKMEAVGQLAGGIAHDFNNALTGIMGAAEMLRDRELAPERRQKFADLILVSAERAGSLTRKLLAFSRKAAMSSAPVEVAAVVDDTVAILHRTLDRRIRILVENEAASTRVIGDDALLQNAFLNMGINAGHAMPDGGTLTFRLEVDALDEAYCRHAPFALEPGPFLKVSVQDTGCGMPPEVLGRIFEPFFTTRSQGKGTGLGLSAVYGTVLDHHGAIQAYSEQGKGTVFHVYLPLATDAKSLAATVAPLEHGQGTILLVDDEELIRLTGKAILERLGYAVLTAEDGAAGLAVFQEHRNEIRLVILDMIMPVIGGRDTLRSLRTIDARVPVIICSGFSRQGELPEVGEGGAVAFLHKPFRQAELAATVAQALRDQGLFGM
jgi:PAS domain S-box-containing protein